MEVIPSTVSWHSLFEGEMPIGDTFCPGGASGIGLGFYPYADGHPTVEPLLLLPLDHGERMDPPVGRRPACAIPDEFFSRSRNVIAETTCAEDLYDTVEYWCLDPRLRHTVRLQFADIPGLVVTSRKAQDIARPVLEIEAVTQTTGSVWPFLEYLCGYFCATVASLAISFHELPAAGDMASLGEHVKIFGDFMARTSLRASSCRLQLRFACPPEHAVMSWTDGLTMVDRIVAAWILGTPIGGALPLLPELHFVSETGDGLRHGVQAWMVAVMGTRVPYELGFHRHDTNGRVVSIRHSLSR